MGLFGNKIRNTCGSILILLFLMSAASATTPTFVYTNNDNDTQNNGGPNSVTGFSVGQNGQLSKIGDFNALGRGFGGSYFGASSIVVCGRANRLYVSNNWSNDITGFNIDPVSGNLSIILGSPFASGVPQPDVSFVGTSLACTPDGKFLLVGNGAYLGAHSISADGSLTMVAGSPFGPFTFKILGIRVTPNGKFLMAGSAPAFQMFSIASDGSLTFVAKTPPLGGLGVDINSAGILAYGSIGGGLSQVAGCSIGATGIPVLLPGSPFFGTGTNESSFGVVLGKGDRFLYVSDSGSSLYAPMNILSVFTVAANGSVSETAVVPHETGRDGRPIGMSTNREGTLLFAAELHRDSVPDGVGVFVISETGELTQVSGSPFPVGLTPLTGVTSLAVFPSPDNLPRGPFDFDGDNKTDVSVYRPSNGLWYLDRSTAGGFVLQLGNSTDRITPADFDGDLKTDIAVYRQSAGAWYVYQSSDGAYITTQFGIAEDLPAPGDYDGDGKADIAIYRPSTGTWWLNRTTAGLIAIQFGLPGDVPVPGDFDGDGKADLVVYRPSNGIWYMQRSTAGGYAIQFGNATDKIAPADYDGDDKMDVGIYRPSQGTWYSFNSSNSTYPVTVFGLATDVPAPGDYDGDGKADIAIFRPSNGQWWLNRTTSGLTVVQFGSNGDKPTPNAFGN